MSASRSATTVTIAADPSTCFACCAVSKPVHRLPLRQRPIAMRDWVYPVTAPDIATHQAQTRPAGGVHRNHGVYQHAVCIALLHRAKAAATPGGGREFHLATVLDRQNVPPSACLPGSVSPALNQLRGRHLRIGKEPPGLQFTAAVAAQPAQAYRFAQHHLFEDRSPPLSRRRSPNDPRDISMAAPVLCQPRDTESYSGRVAQGQNAATGENVRTFHIRHYMCACPSAKAGMTTRGARSPSNEVLISPRTQTHFALLAPVTPKTL